MSLVVARDLHKYYSLGGKELQVLKGINLEIQSGETVAIVGPSGVGKSTLLHLLGALDRPTRGDVELDGVRLGSLTEQQLAQVRATRLGFVFQFHHLLPEFTAFENVCLAGLIAGGKPPEQRLRAIELLTRVGLEQRLEHKPGELSGGEQQRVALARALHNNPPLVLADEPTGNLDRSTALQLQDLVFELARERQVSFLVVTHDLKFAERCNRILHLRDGQALSLTREAFQSAHTLAP